MHSAPTIILDNDALSKRDREFGKMLAIVVLP